MQQGQQKEPSAPGRTVRIRGRVLVLADDPSLIEAQLQGRDVAWEPGMALLDRISTDEIAPAWACYWYDQTIARYVYVGLRGAVVSPGSIESGGFELAVSGVSKGCGSSREQAPFAELAAGIRVVVARSIEKIYAQNAQNIGLLTTTDFTVLERLLRGEAVPIDCFTAGLDPISAAVVEQGGLFAFNRARMNGSVRPPEITTPHRPMTLCEKILARHAVVDATRLRTGVPAVRPGDALFARCDVRFSHEYVTAMSDALFRNALGPDAELREPASVYLFRDHLTFLEQVMPEEHVRLGLREQAARLAREQEHFARRHRLAIHGEMLRNGRAAGSEAICHNKVLEDIALPGQLVLGTDSHTCMAGAVGCVAFGVGATDMANAWFTGDVRVKVPATVLVLLGGRLRAGVCAKDAMLSLLARPLFRSGDAIGKVLEFSGQGVAGLSLDERATLTNMSVEGGGFTGIVEADDLVVAELAALRGTRPEAIRRHLVRGDRDAEYAATLELDLSLVEPMVATPGDPRNGVPLRHHLLSQGRIPIHIAYGGSCTGAKKADMDMYAAALQSAADQGQRVAEGVELYIQFGSQQVREYAERRGHIDLFERVGATVLDPSCGACIRAGPGVSSRAEQVTVSAVNRNFPGRSGPGSVYLASPYVVAASAIAGCLALPPGWADS